MSQPARFSALLTCAAALGIATGLLVVRLRDGGACEDPVPPPPQTERVAVPGPLTLDPGRADDPADWYVCRVLFPSALTYDTDGRIVPAKATAFSVRHTVRLAFQDGAALSPAALMSVLAQRVLPYPDDRLKPLLEQKGRRWTLGRPVVALDAGSLELHSNGPAHGAVEAFAELLTPKVVDAARSRLRAELRLTFKDAATARRYKNRAEELKESPLYRRGTAAVLHAELSPDDAATLVVTTDEGAWLAALPWTCPVPEVRSGSAYTFTIAGSYEEAHALFERKEVEAAFILEEDGIPTGRVDHSVIGFNLGRMPDANLRRTIREGRPLRSSDELTILVRREVASDFARARELAGALGPFVHVQAVPAETFDASIRSGRFDLFVGSIVTGAGADLSRWFHSHDSLLGYGSPECDRLLEALDHALDPQRRTDLARQIWDRAAADHAVVPLARRPVFYVSRGR